MSILCIIYFRILYKERLSFVLERFTYFSKKYMVFTELTNSDHNVLASMYVLFLKKFYFVIGAVCRYTSLKKTFQILKKVLYSNSKFF